MGKRIISILVLILYVHGLSGYTMSIHTCMITGNENVYTGFGNEDPCEEEERHCDETDTHFEQADCCSLQQTVVSVDEDSNISSFQLHQVAFLSAASPCKIIFSSQHTSFVSPIHNLVTTDPPDLTVIGVFRI